MESKTVSLLPTFYYSPYPTPLTCEILKDEDDFWKIVEEFDYEKYDYNYERLYVKACAKYTEDELDIIKNTQFSFEIMFYNTYNMIEDSFRTDGDEFNDFINLVISKGKTTFYKALHNRNYGIDLYNEHLEKFRSIPESYAYVFMMI